ncbi:MAG: glutamate--tRNA ligase [bacterium]
MSDSRPVRTRIAPSPTGSPHIGTAYVALFNHAFAGSRGGKFILRIEDTDQVRSTRESEKEILEALRWLGISWAEGPDVGGPFGPYRQSERTQIYRDHCRLLMERGHAYPCFCSGERLAQLRRDQAAAKQAHMGYDGVCAGMPAGEAARRMSAGEPFVIRMKVPKSGECVFEDRLRGTVKMPWEGVDDQILMKSGGFPTYHLANVVDDHMMEITHVIRGEEWLNSVPKHILLYQYFGWQAPEFAHLPLLRNPDKSKLSKRKNPTSILYYRAAGFLPEAVLNYLGLMAYSRSDGREIFSLMEMVETFDLDRVSLGGPIFDLQKLTNFNGQYIREFNVETLEGRFGEWKLNSAMWRQILQLAQPRLNRLCDLVPMAAFLFADRLDYSPTALIGADVDAARAARLIKIAQWEMEKSSAWTRDVVRDIFNRISEQEDLKLKKLLPTFFVAIAGSTVSLPLFESIELLGRDIVVRRLQYALEALATSGGELKGKVLDELEKYHAATYGLKK